ncbi:MAG: hypothetical protein WC341_15355 [Bacteroidales bacterium]|jgi:hypothetical protein
MTQKKGELRLLDGRIVPEFVEQYRLPIATHRPHKWAMVDLEDGSIWVLRPDQPPDAKTPKSATKQDIALIKKIVRVKS